MQQTRHASFGQALAAQQIPCQKPGRLLGRGLAERGLQPGEAAERSARQTSWRHGLLLVHSRLLNMFQWQSVLPAGPADSRKCF